jgi:hypothetical protein
MGVMAGLDGGPTPRPSADLGMLAGLCDQLNQTGCTYPGTDLLLRYEVKPHSGPA